MNTNQISALLVAAALGLAGGSALTYSLLSTPQSRTTAGDHDSAHDDHDADFERGPHHGRLLTDNDFALEVTIYERGIPPQFRVYAFENGEPIALHDIDLSIRLSRLGGRVDEISFRPEGEYLRGDKVVEEPHSFDVQVTAQRNGQDSSWNYSTYEGRVVLSPEAMQHAGIEVTKAGAGRIVQTLTLRGEIVLNADEVAHIAPRVSGQVREVHARAGEDVREGAVLALIDSRELAQAKAALLAAETRLSLTRASVLRAEKLFQKKIAPEQELLRGRQEFAEAEIEHRMAEANLHALGLTENQVRQLSEQEDVDYPLYEIRAPFDGTIIQKHITPGEVVGINSDVFMLADLSTVWVDLTVYPKDTPNIRPGQPLIVSFAGAIPDAQAVVDYITPVVDESTRTATARATLQNDDRRWRPGLFVTAKLIQNETTAPVVVDAAAIQTFRDWSVVYVKYGDTFEARPLELGIRNDRWIEVVAGLSPGEEYVSKNSFALKAELGKEGASHHH